MAGFVAGCALAAGAGAASTGLQVHADPGLFPAFAPGTHDYVVRCKSRTPVSLSVVAPRGTTVAVGDRAPRSGSFHVSVPLRGGRGVTLRVRSPDRERTYGIRCLPSDFPTWTADRRREPQARYYVLAPAPHQKRGAGYAAIFDDHGVPVWWKRDDPAPFNATLLPDGGIAWTQLTGRTVPQSTGRFEEYALDGTRMREFTANHGVDLHELSVLGNGHAFVISYVSRFHVDLSRWGGPSDTGVFDGYIQELDKRGASVWHWSTRGHVPLGDTAPWFHRLLVERKPVPTPAGDVYDIVHMNSLEPFGDRLVVSLRNTNAVYEIDRPTGRVLWKLGGRRTAKSLKVIGDPLASPLDGQHDARLTEGGRHLTVYDNGILARRPPRAVEYRIDRARRTATFVGAVEFPPAGLSTCCGGARRLPGGHWVVSWGNTPWVTELTSKGDPVLLLRFPDRTSYRVDPVGSGTFTRGGLRRAMDAMARRR